MVFGFSLVGGLGRVRKGGLVGVTVRSKEM